MERLLADATRLTGIKYDINNLGNVYAAIHAVQSELGLTGVAAEEAKTTLTGSAQEMKASWENFLAALTTGEGLDAALENLGTSVMDFGGNLLGMLGEMARSLPDVLIENLNKLSDAIVQSFDDPDAYEKAADKIIAGLGAVVEKGGQLGWALAKALILGLGAGINGIFTVIDKLGKAAGGKVAEWYATGAEYVQNLISGAATKVETWKTAAGALIDQAKTTIASKYSELVTAGENVVSNIKVGVESKVSEVLTAIRTMISDIWNSIINFNWSSLGSAIVDGIKSGINSMASSVTTAAANVKNNLVSGFKSLFRIASPSKLMADEVGKWIPAGIAVGMEQNSAPLDASVVNLGRGLVDDLRRYTAPGMLYQDATAQSLDGLATRINDRPVAVSVFLEGDARQIFRVVRRDDAQFARETGVGAFAGGYA